MVLASIVHRYYPLDSIRMQLPLADQLFSGQIDHYSYLKSQDINLVQDLLRVLDGFYRLRKASLKKVINWLRKESS